MKVSRSDVVKNILPSLSFITLHIVSMDICIWGVQSQLPSFALVLDFADFPVPLRAGAASAGFSAALISTADRAHWSKKPYISSSCLCCWMASCSSDSRSPWMMSASTDNPDTTKSRSLLRDRVGRKVENLLSKFNSSA